MSSFEPLDESSPPSEGRPPLPRSNSVPSSTSPSMESLTSVRKPRASTILPPALKKRHSAYVLSPPPDQPKTPIPGIPPQRPLRNPAREIPGPSTVPSKPKSRSRPSTATGSREEVTPWEFSPGPESQDCPPTPPLSGGNSEGGSPTLSTRTRPSLKTGTVAEVTPWELFPVQTKTGRSSLTTGLVEEVTPWELYPVPTTPPARSSLATGLVEEVTPWELYPPPTYDGPSNSATINQKRSRPSSYAHATPLQPKVYTSFSQGKSLSDLTHIRRRKSAGVKTPKVHSPPVPGQENTNADERSSHKQPPASPQSSLKFSTADRTILEELKRNIRARAAQFVTKGVGSGIKSVGGYRGKKYHPYPPEEVPYPRSYEREILDLDVWETAFCQDICKSPTWHVFEVPPTKVLDLGCGTGTWILNCARSWRDCQFVGLDVVPLHPDLQQVGSPDLASRITWVQSNFLEGLPFPNEEFDFVHVKRIGLGVPEDKWDLLLEEIARVMKPGGAFEMLEEDLFFPGKLMDLDSDTEPDSESEHHSSRQGTTVVESNGNGEDYGVTASASSRLSEGPDGSPIVPTNNSITFGTSSRSTSSINEVAIAEEGETDEAQELLEQVYPDYQSLKTDDPKMVPPPQPSDRPLLHIHTSSNQSLTSHPPPQPKPVGSAYSLLMSSIASIGPPDNLAKTVEGKGEPRPRGYSLTSASIRPRVEVGHIPHNRSLAPLPGGDSTDTPSSPFIRPPQILLRTTPKPPTNPRDHSLLERIYTEMLGSRFINISPLALLANSLGLHFKDVRTHPPLQYAFPPMPAKLPIYRGSDKHASLSETDSSSDSDDARDAILPSPVPRSAARRASHRVSVPNINSEDMASISEENRYLNVRGLIHHSSPYITLDETRISALSPSTKISFSSSTSKPAKSRRSSRLPNTTMNLDLRSLNLHLALRAAEILGCSETMWEWVVAYQAAARASKNEKSRMARSGSVDLSPRSTISIASSRDSLDSIRDSILDLTREDFDGLLSKFDMDMRDNFALGDALQDRFSWTSIPLAPSSEWKNFRSACKKWDKWEHKQRHLSSSYPYHSSSRHQLSKSHTAVNTSHEKSDIPSPEKKRPISTADLKTKRTTTPGGVPQPPPTHRLSRAMRVFVAWKA